MAGLLLHDKSINLSALLWDTVSPPMEISW